MEISSFACSAENKKLNFASFMSSGTLMHQTSNMGMHHCNEMPFVELTGHKLQEPIVSSSFEINRFGITGKIHSFAANAKHFVRSDNTGILTRKDLYSHQFPAFSFSQLVGGFVGSKSQIGSSSKESCQMWDIIFDKLAEFCGTRHHPQNCYNFSEAFSQDVLKSFCKKEKPSSIVIENSANVTSHSTLSPKPNNSKDISDCSSRPSSDPSKQSYAEVAKIFATVHQNKQTTSTPSSAMPQKRNTSNRRNFVKCDISRTIANNWRNHCSPPMKEYRNHTRFFSGSQRRSDNKNFKSAKHFEKEQKTDKNKRQIYMSESQRVDNKKNCRRMISDSVQIAPRMSAHQECHVAAVEPSNKVNRVTQTSPMRMRFFSECSTDSDDSFVVFDSEADCDSVILTVMPSSTSDSDLSEDVCSYQFSDDEDDNIDYVDGGDTETVTELSELNERWETENSAYPASKKNPVKGSWGPQVLTDNSPTENTIMDALAVCAIVDFVENTPVHFASNDSLETVRPMVAWNFAYRAARCGPWEQMARDRERFKIRIKQIEPVLAEILSPEHRCRVWKKKMASVPTGT